MKKKVILASGLTSGMGKEFLKKCNEKKYKIIHLTKNKRLKNKKIFKNIICDFSDPLSIKNSLEKLKIKIDIFINFAGIIGNKKLQDEKFEETMKIINVNLISPMVILSKIIKKFNKDSICILISSQSAFKGSFSDSYAISKQGLVGVVNTLCSKLAPRTRIVSVAPGITTNTKMTDKETKKDLKIKSKTVPLKRFCSAENVADLCHFLISEKGKYFSGTTIHYNGGNVIR